MTDTQQEIQIRAAVLDDAEALVSLLNPIIEAGTTALDTRLTVAGERDYIASLPERAIFLVAALTLDVGQGFRVIGTAERHAKIDGRYIDEVLIERFLSD